MAIVHSKIRVKLRVYEMSDSAGQASFSVNVTGMPTARLKGDEVELKVGRNEVDDAFWAAWKEQNKDGLFLSTGTLKDDTAPAAAEEKVR